MPNNRDYPADAIRSLIRDFRGIADAFGWLRNEGEQHRSKVLECTLAALLMHYFEQGRSTQRSLTGIMEDLRSLPSFEEVSELDLILSILLFEYDKDLLVRSKELISKTWEKLDLPAVNGKFVNGRLEPKARLDYHGMSLVLFFNYPEAFRSELNGYMTPVRGSLWETPCHHFTIFNIGTQIPVGEIDSILSLVKADLEQEIRKDFYLNNLVRDVRQAALKPEVHVVSNDSLVLFGAGIFLRSMHELRLRLREKRFHLNSESVLARDAQPVWTHTVFARLIDRVEEIQGEEMKARRLPNAGKHIALEEARLGLLVFEDEKGLLVKKVEEITVVSFNAGECRARYTPVI